MHIDYTHIHIYYAKNVGTHTGRYLFIQGKKIFTRSVARWLKIKIDIKYAFCMLLYYITVATMFCIIVTRRIPHSRSMIDFAKSETDRWTERSIDRSIGSISGIHLHFIMHLAFWIVFFKCLSRIREILEFLIFDHRRRMRINNRMQKFHKKMIAIEYVNGPRNNKSSQIAINASWFKKSADIN